MNDKEYRKVLMKCLNIKQAPFGAAKRRGVLGKQDTAKILQFKLLTKE